MRPGDLRLREGHNCPVIVQPYPGVYTLGGNIVGSLFRFCQQGTGGKGFCYLHERLRAARRLDPIPGTEAFTVIPLHG